ncbi:FecR family protein [Pseudomonas sp. H9]|uniref:FecR family protein n=1 Tax=Pseudomonas sp. H9 TaxID=483968 RepID=UPI001057E917|nr:FecR domain-containing protein [Pseudomonas sp. H9]TDF82082.1 iron dicitrate transport regulator FecR [Pseudomonas sp. H9]
MNSSPTSIPSTGPGTRIHQAKRREAPRAWLGWAIAAGVLLAGGLFMWSQLAYLQRLISDVATDPGERRQIQLADGSRLTLDGASAVDVDLRGPVRKVRLVQGQVFINVMLDGRPFEVDIGETRVQVFGTHLSASRGLDHDEVVLFKGKVEVSSQYGEKRLLTQGQRLIIRGASLGQAEKVDAERLLAWRDGQASKPPVR